MIDIRARADCNRLVDSILQTMVATGYNVNTIRQAPAAFQQNDSYILNGLSGAILSIQAVWQTIVPILPGLQTDFHQYDVAWVAALTNNQIQEISRKYQVQARFFERGLLAIRHNAGVFQHIQAGHRSVWEFIRGQLPQAAYNGEFYERPNDQSLIDHCQRRYRNYHFRRFKNYHLKLPLGLVTGRLLSY